MAPEDEVLEGFGGERVKVAAAAEEDELVEVG